MLDRRLFLIITTLVRGSGKVVDGELVYYGNARSNKKTRTDRFGGRLQPTDPTHLVKGVPFYNLRWNGFFYIYFYWRILQQRRQTWAFLRVCDLNTAGPNIKSQPTATRIKLHIILNFDAGQRKMVLLDNDAVRDFADLAAVAIADIIAISAAAAAAASYLVYIVHCYKSPRHHTYGEANRLSGALVR